MIRKHCEKDTHMSDEYIQVVGANAAETGAGSPTVGGRGFSWHFLAIAG